MEISYVEYHPMIKDGKYISCEEKVHSTVKNGLSKQKQFYLVGHSVGGWRGTITARVFSLFAL